MATGGSQPSTGSEYKVFSPMCFCSLRALADSFFVQGNLRQSQIIASNLLATFSSCLFAHTSKCERKNWVGLAIDIDTKDKDGAKSNRFGNLETVCQFEAGRGFFPPYCGTVSQVNGVALRLPTRHAFSVWKFG